MVALAVVLAVAVGISLGMLGGGGSILAVPLLIYVAGLETKAAIATSLVVVGVTALVGIVPHARAGRVRWRTGLFFGAAGMVGAYAGGRLAAFVSGSVLLVLFGLMMLATAVAMIRGCRRCARVASVDDGDVDVDGDVDGDGDVVVDLPIRHVVVEGIVVGLVTGLVGAGGGFLVVPALVLLGRMPMPTAVGTSLVVISMKSFAGLAGYLATVEIDWSLAAAFTAAAVLGSVLGGRWAGRIPQETLRKAFGWFVVAAGTFVLGQQALA